MSKVSIIHIDDEESTLQFCKTIFEESNLINYLAGFKKAKEAICFLETQKVDIVFCDIEMPENNGFWVANNLPSNIPVVFITGHSDFALEAFEACALHYLIKPLSLNQVINTIKRYKDYHFQSIFKEQVSQFYNHYLPQNSKQLPTRIYINNIGKIVIINLNELIYMEGAGNYTKFYMISGEMHTSSKNLKIYSDSIVHHPDFVRIHKSYIVNKNFVKQIVKLDKQQWFIEMKNEEKLELSKGRLSEILEQLQS